MNKKMKHLLATFCLLLCASAASAQTSHWTQVSANDFQYDMTIFFTLGETDDNDVFTEVADLSNYEVAAFVGSELRGVAEIWNVGDPAKKVGYLRVRSNTASGEKLSFKFYNTTTQEEKTIFGTDITFESQAKVGEASSPEKFVTNGGIIGDVNGDEAIDLTDASLIFRYYSEFFEDEEAMTDEGLVYNNAAADVNGDGSVDLTDASLVFRYYSEYFEDAEAMIDDGLNVLFPKE